MPIDVEIVTPEKLLVSRPADMAVIPAAEGEMGVLKGHAPMIVLLKGGFIRLYEDERVVEQYFVWDGFAEVTPDRCTILANKIDERGKLSLDVAKDELISAEEKLSELLPSSDEAREILQERVMSARTLVAALENR